MSWGRMGLNREEKNYLEQFAAAIVQSNAKAMAEAEKRLEKVIARFDGYVAEVDGLKVEWQRQKVALLAKIEELKAQNEQTRRGTLVGIAKHILGRNGNRKVQVGRAGQGAVEERGGDSPRH